MGEFNYGYLIVYGILNIAAIALLIIFIVNLIKTYRRGIGKPSQQRRVIRTLILFVLLIIVPIVSVNLIDYEPNFETREERIEHHSKYKNYFHLNYEYYNQLQKNPLDLSLHFQYVNTIRSFIDNVRNRGFDPSSLSDYYASKRMVEYYKSFIDNKDTTHKDIGYTFLAIHYTNIESKADTLLDSISNLGKKSPYYLYAKGRMLSQSRNLKNFEEAEDLLKKTNSDTIIIAEAFNELAFLYFYFHKEDQLELIALDPIRSQYIEDYFIRVVHFRSFNVISYFKIVIARDLKSISLIGSVSAFLILLLWIFYLRRIDIYEPEKWSHTIITLFMSMITIYLVFPLGDFLWDTLRYYPSNDAFETFIYDSISIGLIEEFVKIIPVLMILRFTKAINEPFDYIYYCSVSALGFAFVENLGYIQDGSLYNINARAMMAAVGHIVFTSTIGYGLVLSKYKRFGGSLIFFLVFLIIAALLHGFYDYWLINGVAVKYSWVTTLFFIIGVHIWHIYANNTLNITTFYNKEIVLKNDRLKNYLILSLLTIFMIAFVVNSFTRGTAFGFSFLLQSTLIYGYFIFYLTFSLSRFAIIRGYFKPLSIPVSILIPRVKRTTDYSNLPVTIKLSRRFHLVEKHTELSNSFPVSGLLERRIVIDNNLESYLVVLYENLRLELYERNRIILIPKFRRNTLNDDGNVLCFMYLIHTEEILEAPVIKSKDLEFAGWVLSHKRGEDN